MVICLGSFKALFLLNALEPALIPTKYNQPISSDAVYLLAHFRLDLRLTTTEISYCKTIS